MAVEQQPGRLDLQQSSGSGVQTIPQKSSSDDREYRHVSLSNRLAVLLIHDASADKAAAAMDVHVGSL